MENLYLDFIETKEADKSVYEIEIARSFFLSTTASPRR